MTDFSFYSENSVISPASSSSYGLVDDSSEDACSICLEPFNVQDPATLTSCKHEYHLQCILEWSQRSKECPICWQFLFLKDPVSQELLAAVAGERNARSRQHISPAASIVHHFSEDTDFDHDASYSDDSDFDERIMQHLASAASRAHYVRRRGRHRSSGSSQVIPVSPSANMPGVQQTYTTSPGGHQDLDYELSDGDLRTLSIPPTINVQPEDSSIVNMLPSATVNRDGHYKPRVVPSQAQRDNPGTRSPPELFSISESIRSKWSAASARYKESISKSTRGFKEKLLARNNSVKEVSKGVQRDMNAGIARMLERLDISSKRNGSCVSNSSCTVGTSNKGKGVQDNVTAQSLNGSKGEIVSNTIPGQIEVSHAQNGR